MKLELTKYLRKTLWKNLFEKITEVKTKGKHFYKILNTKAQRKLHISMHLNVMHILL